MDMDQQREDALQNRGSCCWFPETGRGMAIGEKGEDGLQDQGSCWMPAASYRPILPRPPQSKPHQEMLMASNTLAFGSQESEGNRLLINFGSPDRREENGFFDYGAGAGAGTGYSVGASAESHFNGMAQWKGVKCVELLALADASVAVSAGDDLLHGTGSAVLGETQYEIPFGHHPYDLNLLPGTTDAAGLSKIIPQFAPITPDKAGRVDRVQDSEIPNSNADDRRDHDMQDQLNAGAATINILEPENNKDPNKDPSKFATDSSYATLSTQLQENHNPDKGGIDSIDLNKTPQQKPRRRKHRPKVITEGKPKRTPKPSGPEENQRVRRKYVRKNALNKNTTPPPEEFKEHTGSNKLKSTKRSCRRALNFDIEEPRDGSSSCRSLNLGSESQAPNRVQAKSTGKLGNGIESVVDNTQIGIAHELVCSANQMLKDHLSLFEQEAPTTPHPTRSSAIQEKLYVNSQKENTTEGKGQVSTHIGQENTKQTMLDSDTRSSPRSPNDSNCSTTISATKEKEQGKGSKRKYSNAVEQADPRTRNFIGANYNNLQAYYKMMSMISWVHFPNIYKKKRTDKGQNPAVSSSSYHVSIAENVGRQSNASYWAFGPQFNASNVSTPFGEAGRGPPNKQQAGECMLPLYQTEMSKKRRSRGPTRVRDLASLTRTPEHIFQRTYLTKQPPADCNGQRVENCDRTQTCIDALATEVGATLAKKKRTKRTSLSSSSQSVVIYKKPSFAKSSGVLPKAAFKLLSVDAITEQLKSLNINRESSRFAYQGYNVISDTQNQEHNALVLYRRDDTIVTFEGSFDPTKKRRTRAKVDLDEETDRVWKLLLENINNEGIDGTDEQKAKWWEEERRVFRGRADSFIARMHLVQGDRRFSPWKGSVVDSVVGVFLTQNVSDHLSSSAFMSVAAHFPLKSRSNQKSCYVEVESLVEDETEVCISEPVCDWSSITFNDSEYSEEKVARINENSGSTTEGVVSTNETECKLSHSSEPCQGMYHNSVNRSTANITRMVSECRLEEDMRTYDVVSSQNSVDSSTSQTVEKSGSCESNSETEDPPNPCKNSSLDHSTSFVELLQKAESTMLREVYSHRSSHMSSHDKSSYEQQPICMQHDERRQNINREEAFLDPSSDCCLHPTTNPGVLQVECFDLFREVTQSSNTSKNIYEDNLGEQSALTAESVSHDTIHNKLTMNVQEAPRCSSESCISIQEGNNMVESQIRVIGTLNNAKTLAQEQSNKMQHNCLNISGETIDIMQNETEPNLNEQGYSMNKEFSKMNATTSKAKNRRAGKEKKDQLDWDKLRKQAESNGRKRAKTPNTLDSLDWEAVRCADVSEIAQTIKERGMNNMLAERIKDFLNRLVREHGSIDLEWLRDVPPDQAKEYLLSFRGLGLKSVECVRLLTLHHLAFPVDTNVGRIAVRLGWVPLQPLPESLQLHLLELYPVLESIQKYLWPRLCKLDQRTLYELHYQMITFGKVFCTKNKPNCNACPMRGDCRHFASAFASARLALPGPEERSIVSATEDRTAYPNAAQMNNKVPLPLLQATKQLEESQQLEASQQSEKKPAVGNCEPIIEEPATPEPECTEIIEDIEDLYEDPDEIPTIKLNIEQFTQNLQNYMQENMELQEGEMSKALVSLTPEAASIPTPKLKNVSRLRTEHQVYELPDSHPLVEMLQLEKREPDDPCNYLLAIWTPGETANSIQPPEKRCSSQELGKLCDDKECFSCNSAREANSQKVRGTLLIPCRTAMRGSFPLNGTYFQVNEVFADHDSSLNPIDVPRAWLWKLNRRTVYFGTSIPTIFKGLTTPAIQQCFWKGYVCVRGFDQKTRAPRPLMARLHFPASKLSRPKGSGGEE